MDQECPVCFAKLTEATVEKTVCNHSFCRPCLERWKQQNNTCPYCREVISEARPVVMEATRHLLVGSDALIRRMFRGVNYSIVRAATIGPFLSHNIRIELNGERDWVPDLWKAYYRNSYRNDMVELLNSGLNGCLLLNGINPPNELFYCSRCKYIVLERSALDNHTRVCTQNV